MTDPSATDPTVNTAAVEAMLQTLLKGLRATQLYMPNNPVYQSAIQNLTTAFGPVWEETSELVLHVVENDLKWEGQVVLSQPRAESLAWLLFKDGVRTLTLLPGCEESDIPALLGVLQKARTLPPDADDDLLTLLWEQDLQLVKYQFVEFSADDAAPLAKAEEEAEKPEQRPPREQIEQEPEPEQSTGLVNVDDFDSTLYFLDDKDIAYLKSEIEREYQQDLRGNILAILFDLFELQTFATVRNEIVSIIENFLPYLLGVGDFRSVAFVLRELKSLMERARELGPDQRQQLEILPERLSQSDAVSQLLQSLDEAVVHPTEEELTDLFGELRGEALETILTWLPKLSNARVKDLLHLAVQRMAGQYPDELAKAMGSDDEDVALETVRLAAKLKAPSVVPALGSLLIRDVSAALKVATVEALAGIGSPGAMQQLERGIGDEHRDVRVAAVRVLGGRGHRAAFPKIEALVVGKDLKGADLTEKMVYFEAYGLLAPPGAIRHLKPLLGGGGFMKKKEDAETRACVAMALGKLGTPEARELLEQAKNDKDALVRNAINKALREGK
ncbi:MAG TPA: HEAT repeat domain-containing protein [Gemmatimonadales bacterium]